MPRFPAAEIPDEARVDCESIAYEFIGAVQPHAALLVAEAQSGLVLQATQNVTEVLGIPHEHVLGKTWSSLNVGVDDSWNVVSSSEKQGRYFLGKNRAGVGLLLRCNTVQDRVLVSIEPETLDIDAKTDPDSNLFPGLVADLYSATNVKESAQAVVNRLRRFLGFDRALVFQFDSDWNGEVIAESLGDAEIEPYLGLKFPSSDIPSSARRLYEQCEIRHVVDHQATPSQLIPQRDPFSKEHVDLTSVLVRSSGESCRKYRRNMGVHSSLMVPVKVDGKIWGHISCFHSKPCRVPHSLHESISALGQSFAMSVGVFDADSRLDAEKAAFAIQRQLAEDTSSGEGQLDSLKDALQRLRSLLRSDTAFLALENEIVSTDPALNEGQINELLAALRGKPFQPFHTDCISRDLPGLSLKSETAGLLAIPFDGDWQEAFILLRHERDETTVWAGDPRNGLTWEKNGKPKLNPRSSFESYLAKSQGSSIGWTEEELMIASSCTMILGLQLLRMKAQMAKESQETFLANMSHEIRTPLTAIIGFTELIRNGEIELRQFDEILATVERNGKHLLALINDILDFSKLQTGEFQLEWGELNLRQIAKDLGRTFSDKAKSERVKLTFKFSDRFPKKVVADETRLTQILVNLIGNAIKFSTNGTVSVEFGYQAESELIQVRVVDTGIGMTETQLDRIRQFAPFRQADPTMARKFGGTGLGLAISKGLVERMQGSLEVDSEHGVGSTFAFSIRNMVHEVEPSVARKVEPNANAKTTAAADSLDGVRILLVEDGIDNQRLIGTLLKRVGADVTLAENGLEAIETVEAISGALDLVLMDMQMPVMDGYVATKKLRESGCELPIIGLSAHAMNGARDKCIDVGCNDYATKPVDRQRLYAICQQYGKTDENR